MGFSHLREQEKKLVERCLARDNSAWHELEKRYARALRAYVRKCLSNAFLAGTQVEDVVQSVWCSLVVPNMRRLSAFRPEVGALAGFLNALALQEIRKHIRSGVHRGHREVPLVSAEYVIDPRPADWLQSLWLADIRDHLSSPLAEAWLQEHLGCSTGSIGLRSTPGARRLRDYRLRVVAERVLAIDDRNP